MHPVRATIMVRRGSYSNWVRHNPVISDGEIIAVTNLPWYKSWFGLKPIRLKCGIGKTFKETKFI